MADAKCISAPVNIGADSDDDLTVQGFVYRPWVTRTITRKRTGRWVESVAGGKPVRRPELRDIPPGVTDT